MKSRSNTVTSTRRAETEKFEDWHKSSWSDSGGNCVEVGSGERGSVGLRDTKDRSGPMLTFSAPGWRTFLDGIRNGEFDQGRHQ